MSDFVDLPDEEAERNKKKIIELFMNNVKGRKPDTAKANLKHAGKEGHWLEKQMGLTLNANNSPDILGFEMKNHTTSKTTFGDWSADYRIFKDKTYGISQDDFLKIFGKPNLLKKGRFSWSGSPAPKIGHFNNFGQKLVVTNDDDIVAIYSFSEDKRSDKHKVMPKELQKENLILCKWSSDLMRKRVESKFNQNGWFKTHKDKNGVYESIVFGDPITFENWIKGVRRGEIYFDGGMYQGNPRPYSMWRADNRMWESLITSRY